MLLIIVFVPLLAKAQTTSCNSLSMADTLRVCNDSAINLHAIIIGTDSILNIIWTPSTGLSDTAILSPLLTTTASSWHYVTVNSILPGNIVANGSFTAGNSGFSSSYTYISTGTSSYGHYMVGANPHTFYSGWPAIGDHTSGTGNMLIVDGSTTAGTSFWCETTSVSPGKSYVFSLWAASLQLPLPSIQIKINGVSIDTVAPSSTIGIWGYNQVTWNSGTDTTANICLTDMELASGGNDFAIDDISFQQVCSAMDSIYANYDPVGAITGTMQVCVGATTVLGDTSVDGVWSSVSAGIASIGSTGLLTGISAGISTIHYTTGLPGCSASQIITVNPIPAIISGGLIHACTSSTITLSDSIGGGTWVSSNPSIATVGSTTGIFSGIVTGITNITYTTVAGCTITNTVTVNPAPSAITGNSNICVGTTTTLSDSSTSGAWSSSTIVYATVGTATGIVSGIAIGGSIITYTLPTGCMATKTVTVISTPAAISGVFNVCTGATTSLSDATTGGTWSGMAGLTIGSLSGLVTGVVAGTSVISYSIGSSSCIATTVVTVNAVPSAIIGATTACIGLTDTLNDFVSGGAWSSSNYDTAFIDAASGVVTGIATGPATITYTLPSGCFTTTPVTVNSAPSAITGASSVCVSATTPLYNSVGGGVWSSSAPGVAGVGSSSGFVTGVSHGSATVSYSTGTGCTVSFPMAVNPVPVAITGPVSVCRGNVITITDSTTGGVWSSPGSTGIAVLGSTTSLSATITGTGAGLAIISYTIGSTSSGAACAAIKAITVNPLPANITGTLHVCPAGTTTLSSGTGGAWSAASPLLTIGSATGTVTGIAHGTGLVSYTLPTGCASIAIVTVNPLPSIISGANSVCVGLTTTLTDSTLTGTWTKSNANVNIGSATGVVTGVTPGTTNIFYTLPFTGCYATKTITVNTSPGAITGATHVCPGATITLGNAITGGTWASSNTGVATVGSTGLSAGMVTGVSPGPVTITYSIGAGCSVSATITVNPLPSVITGTMNLCPGQTTTLSDSVSGGTWNTTSSFASVGSSTGVVTGTTGGAASITYTAPNSCIRTAIVTVNPSPLSISGPSAVCIGSTITLTDPGGGTWNPGSAGIVTIGSATGIVTGDSLGTATITYTLPTGCTTSKTVTVSLSPTAITGPSTVCQGTTISLGDLVGGGLWASSAGAAVGSLSGMVTGISPGASATITYSLGSGCTVTKTVSVIAAPGAITGASGVCVGSSISLTDPAAGGVWHSSSGSATVGSTGSVTGVSAGTATISYTVAVPAALLLLWLL